MAFRVLAVAAACAALCGGAAAATGEMCSSLSGPFCSAVSSDFAAPPAHAAVSLDPDEQRLREDDLNKRLKIEHVLKQYEIEAATRASRSEEDLLLEEISELLGETAALLEEMQAEIEEESPVVGSFAFSSQGDTYDLLETMDGKEMKDFFVLAYDEVLRSWESTLEDMSPEILQALRESVEQLRSLQDYEAFEFRYLDETAQDHMRQRFENHRLIEAQRTFEKLIVAKNAHERHVAYESVIYLFQLAQEEDDLLNEELQLEEEEGEEDVGESARSTSTETEAE